MSFPQDASDFELLVRMVRGIEYRERLQSMQELTQRIRNGKVSREIRLVKGRLQLLNLKTSTIEQREKQVEEAIKSFSLQNLNWQ